MVHVISDAGLRLGRCILLTVAALLLVSAPLLQWAPSVGDGRSQACRDRGAPQSAVPGANPDNWIVEPAQSWWPLGVDCHWNHRGTGETVTVGPGGTSTAVAVTGLITGVAAVALGAGRGRVGRRSVEDVDGSCDRRRSR